jgi:hypothetical protein
MRPNKLRELLKSNKPTLSTHIHTTWPSVAEAIGHTGLHDYVEFVGEYGPFDLHDLDTSREPRTSTTCRCSSNRVWLPQHPARRLPLRRRRECVRIVRAETPEDGGTYGVRSPGDRRLAARCPGQVA